MLKTIGKDAKVKPNRPIQLQKPIEFLPAKTSIKPSIYQRVDKEKRRQKALQIIQFKAEYNLMRKYFTQLKFYHKIIHLLRRVKLSSKYIAFSIIKGNYLNAKDKNESILLHFTQLRKLKVLAVLYKEHLFASKQNSILREHLVSSFQHFISITRANIAANYNTFNTIRRFYFRMFSNRILLKRYSNACAYTGIMKHKAMIKRRYQKKVLKSIKEDIRNRFKTRVICTVRAYEDFISRTKQQIQIKAELMKATKCFLIKSLYSKLIAYLNNYHIAQSKSSIAQMFYEEKVKKSCLNVLRSKSQRMKAFRSFVRQYARSSRLTVKERIRDEKKRIMLLMHKYSQYKREKLQLHKAKFFRVAIAVSNQRKKKAAITRFLIGKMQKRLWSILNYNRKRMKQFNAFIHTFLSIHNGILIQNTLNLMRYKVHQFTDRGKLPANVLHFVQSKLEARMYRFQFKQMKRFYKKARRLLLNKKILLKKLHLAAYFDSKKKKVKSVDSFKRLLHFISCRKVFNSFIKAETVLKAAKVTQMKRRVRKVKESFQEYLLSSWIEQAVSAFSIHHLECIPFKSKGKAFYNWLLSNNKTSKRSTQLSPCYLSKVIQLILFNRFKHKTLQVILYNHYSTLLMESYLHKLLKAKQSRTELKQKFLTIKRECLQNLNSST